MANIKKLCEEYKEYILQTRKAGEKLGELIVSVLKDIMPDIEYSLGWAEAGMDTLCFWAYSRDCDSSFIVRLEEEGKERVNLEDILDKFIYKEIFKLPEPEWPDDYEDRAFYIGRSRRN